jgi:hypothetical protein
MTELRYKFRIQIPSNLVSENRNLLTSSWRLSNINFQVYSAQFTLNDEEPNVSRTHGTATFRVLRQEPPPQARHKSRT